MKHSPILFVVVAIASILGNPGRSTAGMLTVTDDGGFIRIDGTGTVSLNFTPTTTTVSFASAAPGSGFVSIAPPSSSLTINLGGGGDNTLNVNALPIGFTTPTFAINGNDGADLFKINTIHAGGPYTIAGGDGFDTLDVTGLGGLLINTGSSIILNGETIINYSQIESVVTAVPEPSSLALLGMGLTGLCGCRMRRKRDQAA